MTVGQKKQQRRITAALDKWVPILGLDRWFLRHAFINEVAPDKDIIATTSANWEYMDAKFQWYLPAVRIVDDAYLETTVVHELVHCLLDSVTPDGDEHLPTLEFATELVARALVRAAA